MDSLFKEELFQGEMLKDEKVLWAGQPETKVLFTTQDIFLVPFSILWGGFAFFWEITVIVSGGPVFPFVIFGGLFVLAGLYFIFGRFIYKYLKKKKTYYAVTNKRVLILLKTNGNTLKAAFIESIPSMNKKVRSDGIGTIRLNDSPLGSSMYSNTGMDFYGKESMAFFDITGAEEVYNIINKLRNK